MRTPANRPGGRLFLKALKIRLPHVPLLLLGLFFFLPFLWMVSTSLKSITEVFSLPAHLIPQVFVWQNYRLAFERAPFLIYTRNTLFYSVMVVIGFLFSSPLVAYSVSKIEWRGGKILFPIILSTMLLPYPVTMIPLFMVFQKLHLVGGFAPLIIPAFTGGAFYIFLMRQFFLTVPGSLLDAARIDGSSEFRIYWNIMLPLCTPALTSVGIFSFLAAWSDFLGPLVYLTKQLNYTLSLGLHAFMASHTVEWHYLMAISVLFTVPIVIIFFVSQRYFIEGIATTGMKV
ncbi:MAG: carbohydrate ABC transporter permease [Spirochaetia bacterium]